MLTKEPQQTWVFDRYVNGVLMAEGVEVTRASSLEEAMIIAARLAACGPNGETPVLILCNALDALARAEKAEQERDRIDQWRETAIVERDTYSEERDAAEAERDRLAAELAAAQQREAGLREALEMSRQGWRNALELDLLPKQHRHSAKTMADIADAALSNNGRGE